MRISLEMSPSILWRNSGCGERDEVPPPDFAGKVFDQVFGR